jgi:hypothetical protein
LLAHVHTLKQSKTNTCTHLKSCHSLCFICTLLTTPEPIFGIMFEFLFFFLQSRVLSTMVNKGGSAAVEMLE